MLTNFLPNSSLTKNPVSYSAKQSSEKGVVPVPTQNNKNHRSGTLLELIYPASNAFTLFLNDVRQARNCTLGINTPRVMDSWIAHIIHELDLYSHLPKNISNRLGAKDRSLTPSNASTFLSLPRDSNINIKNAYEKNYWLDNFITFVNTILEKKDAFTSAQKVKLKARLTKGLNPTDESGIPCQSSLFIAIPNSNKPPRSDATSALAYMRSHSKERESVLHDQGAIVSYASFNNKTNMKFTEAMAYLLRCQKMQEIVLNFSVEEKLLSAEGLLKIRMAMTPKKGGSNPYHPLVLLGNKEYQPVEVSPSAMFSALRNSQSSLPSLNITV